MQALLPGFVNDANAHYRLTISIVLFFTLIIECFSKNDEDAYVASKLLLSTPVVSLAYAFGNSIRHYSIILTEFNYLLTTTEE